MNRKAFISRVVILVLLTVMITIAGVTAPRFFIDRKIRRSTRYSDSVEIEAISPYGENSVEIEERIKRVLQIEGGIDMIGYESFTSYSSNIDGFTYELFDVINDGFGVRPANAYMAINQKYEIMKIADYTIGNAELYSDVASGLVISGYLDFTCSEYSMYQFWDDLCALYSRFLGIEFNNRSDSLEMFSDSMVAEATTTDGALRLSLWMSITPVSEREYEDTYSISLYFGLESAI